MRVFAIYSPARSAKSFPVTVEIAGELKRRGYTVGLIKAGDDAGVEAGPFEAVSRASSESTAIYINSGFRLEELLRLYRQDYIILEGFERVAAPKILWVEGEENLIGSDDLVFAVTGRFRKAPSCFNGLPLVEAKDIKRLVDFVEEKVFEKLPDIEGGGCGLCGRDCYGMAADILKGRASRKDCKSSGKDLVEVKINGKKLDMVPFVRNMVASVVKGVLSPLKGFEEGEIEIKIRNPGEAGEF
ncbi:Fe-S cluster domain-containing protein [Thermosediminibacter oceani]|uniref:Fe-S cluster domain protein n=1 Tax=Thermosediminibacter oceani (strain ATCC BAA-1034 / DSM 16646 / JW/IW-1228P) TaxID=555079 RepID=D9S2H4_THEOJ|nr:Fe-S cluster domain-containing protein [Thermosediminibacter oceani]ADL07601.1 Fe-S cluster domain protein [Thermosediminibacter oceani DSM 16646]